MVTGKSLYTEQSNNVFKTWVYLIVFTIFLAIVGLAVSYYFQSVVIFYVAIAIALVMNVYSYWYSDKLVLSVAHAKLVKSRSEYPELWNVVENLSITAGIQMPKVYVVNDPMPNAFATGRNQTHAAIAVTTGLLSILNKSELEGVIAHELSHIRNKDILIATVIVVMVSAVAFLSQIFLRFSMFGGGRSRNNNNNGGASTFILIGSILAIVFAPLAATIIQLAISRKREFLADASGAILTRYPEGLASALEKISKFTQPLAHATDATAHLYIVDPLGLHGKEKKKASWLKKLFMTHPPIEDRIQALLSKNY